MQDTGIPHLQFILRETDTFDVIFFFFIGHYSPTALIDPLLLVGHKVRRYAIDFVGFPPRWLLELGQNLCLSYRTVINEPYNDAQLHRYLRMTKWSYQRHVDFMRKMLLFDFCTKLEKRCTRFLYHFILTILNGFTLTFDCESLKLESGDKTHENRYTCKKEEDCRVKKYHYTTSK